MPGPRTAELNGLNWQVQVDPLTLSITSFPPTVTALVAEDDEVLVEDDDDPPQAATAMQTVVNDSSQMKRFTVILRSHSTIAG